MKSGTLLRDRMEAKDVAENPDGEILNGWQYFIERIGAGSTIQQEAERLQVSESSLRRYIWNRKFPERKEQYRLAREDAAEAKDDELRRKAEELLGDGYIDRNGELQPWNRDMVAARKEGLFHGFNRLKFQNRAHFGDSQTVRHEHDVSSALLDRLEQITAQRKERARLEHAPAKVIEANWTEVSEVEATSPREGVDRDT